MEFTETYKYSEWEYADLKKSAESLELVAIDSKNVKAKKYTFALVNLMMYPSNEYYISEEKKLKEELKEKVGQMVEAIEVGTMAHWVDYDIKGNTCSAMRRVCYPCVRVYLRNGQTADLEGSKILKGWM